MFKFKNILVTGAAGFIGSRFVRMLLNKYSDMQVVSLDKLTYAGTLDNLSECMAQKNHHFVQADIQDAALIKSVLREHNIDTIVHFAAESHVDNSIGNPEPFVQTNIVGTFRLLEEARQYWLEEMKWDKSQCRFHHVSTDEVFGSLEKQDNPFTETTPYSPRSPYSASKAASDHFVSAYYHTFGLPVTISNCSNNFGPHQHHEKLIPTVIDCCLNGKKIPVYGTGENIRDWLFVDDHCEAIELILKSGKVGETYNVGGNNEIENLILIKKICSILDKKHSQDQPYENLISFVTDRKGHDKRYAICNKKISQELDWQPSDNFEKLLEETVDWYLKRMISSSVETI